MRRSRIARDFGADVFATGSVGQSRLHREASAPRRSSTRRRRWRYCVAQAHPRPRLGPSVRYRGRRDDGASFTAVRVRPCRQARSDGATIALAPLSFRAHLVLRLHAVALLIREGRAHHAKSCARPPRGEDGRLVPSLDRDESDEQHWREAYAAQRDSRPGKVVIDVDATSADRAINITIRGVGNDPCRSDARGSRPWCYHVTREFTTARRKVGEEKWGTTSHQDHKTKVKFRRDRAACRTGTRTVDTEMPQRGCHNGAIIPNEASPRAYTKPWCSWAGLA